ncbi:MAG: pitrilysin family protein [Rickettsiales bacterium]|nr:pitrilysin family protein [Rickettsiales bacterium]
MKLLISVLFLLANMLSPCWAEVKPITLPNGQSILTLPAQSLPMAVIQISFQDAGSISDSDGKAGRAYVAAAMLKEGAGTLNSPALSRRLEDKAIELSVSANREETTLTLQALTKHIPEALDLATQILTQPRFETNSFEKIRSQALTDLKQRSQSPGWLASIHFDAEAFGEHPYALPTVGTEKSIKGLTVDDLRHWHKHLTAQNMIVSAAGDIDEDSLSQAITKLSLALPKKAKITKLTSAPAIPQKIEPTLIKQTVPQTVAMFGLAAPKRNDPDFYAAYVMNHILGGGGLTSRLSNAIRQQRGLAYYASTSLSPGRYSAAIYGSFATRNESALEALNVAKEVLSTFAEKGATQEEVQNTIDYLTGSFPLALDNLRTQVSYLTSIQRYGLGTDYLKKRNAYFKAVTLDEVNRAAAKILAKPPLVVLVGDPK